MRVLADETGQVAETSESDNGATAALPMIADETAPVITALTPPDQKRLRATATLPATATDNVGVVSYSFAIGQGGPWTDLGTNATGQLVLDTTGYTDGTYLVRVTVSDAAGNASVRTQTYVFDNTAPAARTLAATALEFGIDLSWNASDAPDFAYYRL